MSEQEIFDGLHEIFADVFMRDVPLRPSLTAADVEDWDSLKQIDIVIAVEQRFGVKATTRDLDELRTVGDLVALIGRKAA